MNELIKMKIVVIGGCTKPSEEGCLKCCEVFDEDGNGTLIENILNYPRRGSAFAVNNSLIYVFGGCSEPGKHLKSIEKIDKNFKSTVIKPVMEAEGSCFAFCETTNSLFLCGGFNGLECLNSASLFTFPPFSESSSSFRLPTPLKNSAAVQNPFTPNSILLFGGWDEKRTLNSIFNVSLTDFSITMDALLPYHVEGHTATVVDSSIFLIGGYDGINPISTISKFNENGTQILTEKLEIPRENHCTAFLKMKRELWIIGGWNGTESVKIIERFKVFKNGSLEKLSNFSLNKARQKAGVVVIID